MKIGMRHLRFFILFLVACSLLFHSPSDFEAYAAAGDITPVRIQNYAAEGGTANLQHDDESGTDNSLVQVDSDTFALAYSGEDGNGFISTFNISSDGTDIDEVETLEHDAKSATHNSLVQVDSDTFALAYSGEDDNGYISTFDISSTGVITPVRIQNHAAESGAANLEHDDESGSHNSLVQVDTDTFALAYRGEDGDGFISTFDISSDGTDIDEVATLEHDAKSATHNSLVQVDSDTFALAYSGKSGDGFISTFDISSTGVIAPVWIQNHKAESGTANWEHDDESGSHNSLVQVDSDTFALAYRGEDDNGYISTFYISSTGVITLVKTQALENNLEHDTESGEDNSLVQVDPNTFALAYSGEDDNGFISTFTIDCNTCSPFPTIASSSGSTGDTVTSTTLSYTATFSESVSNFVVGDITVTGTANSSSPIASNFAGSGATYTFDVVKGSSDGTVSVSIAAGAAIDAAGNDNIVSNTYTLTIDTPVAASTASTGGTCSRHVILGNCGTIAINNDEYRIINTWTNVPTTEVLVGQPVTVTLSTPNNPTHTKIHFASVHTEVFSIPLDYQQSAHIDYSIMNNQVTYVSQSQLFQVAGATHRIVQDPDVKNLEMFEVVFTMIFAKPMDTSHVVVETENKFGIPETLYLMDALKVNENLVQALTLEEKSKFSIVDPEPEMEMDTEPEIEMDPEPEQTKKEKSKRQRR